MKILVDTNVILDVLLNRKNFVVDSLKALEKASIKADRLYFSASAVTDVYYLVHKQTHSKETALKAIQQMAEFLIFASVDANCILAATFSKISDFEDAVIDKIASSIKADYILTRNITDFKNAINKVITPSEYLADLY